MYNTIPELYSHVDYRVPVHLSRFRGPILELGDIYRADVYAAYCIRTGRRIMEFNGSCYWEDRRGRVHRIHTHDDLRYVEGNLYNEFGSVVIPYKRFRPITVDIAPSIGFKAQALVHSLAAEGLRDELDHLTVSKHISSVREAVDPVSLDRIHYAEGVLLSVRNAAVIEIVDQLTSIPEYEWRATHMYYDPKQDLVVLEIGMDIRIREYYERRINEEIARADAIDEADVYAVLR